MTKLFQIARPVQAIASRLTPSHNLLTRRARAILRRYSVALLAVAAFASWEPMRAQTFQPTGPQRLSFAQLLGSSNPSTSQAQINAICIDAQGNLLLLLDQKDGIRLLKTDSAASNVLAQTQIGAAGDTGLSMALDPAGNVYVTGTTTSGSMTATSGAAFTSATGSGINSFVAKFDTNLNSVFVTFAGGDSMAASSIAATSDAVFVTGSIFNPTLPATPTAFIQTPAYGSDFNVFVEKFSADGHTLLYATYLSGASGNTTSSAIAVDSSDNAYVAGTTTSPDYPTTAALVPEMLGATSGFLTKLSAAGDALIFSTYVPGGGISSLAIDAAANNLLLSGAISLGQFPVATVQSPLAAETYQTLLRLPLDGSAVLASTILAPGLQSFVTASPTGTAWIAGSLSLPLLPLQPLSSIGNSFAMHVNAAGLVDQTARFGGIASSSPTNAGAPITLTSIAVSSNGNPIVGGSFASYASQSLLSTPTFDLPLTNPTAAFPSSVRAALAPTCTGNLCAGSAAYLAGLTISVAPPRASLALAVDDSPNLTLRNLGSTEATNLQIAVTGFTFTTNCATTLPASEECTVALTGMSPGTITTSADNATTQTQSLPTLAPGQTALPITFSPKELDFGIVSSASGSTTRSITVTNLTQQSQTFTSSLDSGIHSTSPYTFAETSSDCAVAGPSTKLLAPGGVCHITVDLTPSNSSSDDGPIQQYWLVGTRDVQMTAFAQAAALSLSSSEIDFGTRYTSGLRLPRYLYLSNSSTVAIEHAVVTLPDTSPFLVIDRCPSVLEPFTVCQIQFAYQAARTPSTDSVTLSLDQGLRVLITGKTLPQPTVGVRVNPNLNLSTTTLAFVDPIPVTSVSTTTQTLIIRNTGTAPFPLSLALTGEFADTTTCPSTLAGGASCSVAVTFAPAQPGSRQGLLTVTAGAATLPVYVTLSGTGAAILSPADNSTLELGTVIVAQPLVRWYKITHPFTSLTASTSGTPFTVVLVEDIGFGHGQPPVYTFTSTSSGTCFNCWLGVQFTPPATGPYSATLTLTSTRSGSPYILALTGAGLPPTGLLLTPVSHDFGPVPINSTSGSDIFVVTNLVPGGAPITLAPPSVTGDFAVTSATNGGTPCGGPLAYSASCFIEIALSPTTTGPRTGGLTLQAGTTSASAALTGYGSPDPGISLNPTALTFGSVPGNASTLQTIIVANTSGTTEQIGTPSVVGAPNFSTTSKCGSLAPATTCSVAVTFQPATSPSVGTLTIPVTIDAGGAPIFLTATAPLTGSYTSDNAGLAIVPSDVQFGPQATGATGLSRQFTINNLSAKSATLNVALPREFVLVGPPCSSLAPNASCTLSVAFLPLTNGEITGTITAHATPTDGSATLSGTSYVNGYGVGSASLSITGASVNGGVLRFGPVVSGHSAQSTLTLTNTSAVAALTIRRVTSDWPFLSTTSCGATLAPAATCTVTLSYTPLNQAAGSGAPVSITDIGSLVIESDAASGPDLINLTGSSTPVAASSSNSALTPILGTTPGSLTFADTPGGSTSSPQTVALTNTGNATLNISAIQTTPDFLVTGTCSTILPAASCPLTITFTPQKASQSGSIPHVSAIEISSNATTSLEFISLAAVSSTSTVSVTPASLDFGSVKVGASATLSVQLANTGSGPATITSITATGDYSVANGTCPTATSTLAEGSTCNAQVTFTPTQTGSRAGMLTIVSPFATTPLTVALTGSGTQSHMQISPASLSFGPVSLGASASLTLTLSNTGTAPITAIAFAITGDDAITQPCAVTTIAPGASCPATITFTPTISGIRSGTLTISSSDPTSPSTVALTGSGYLLGSFTLTAAGSNSASATVTNGAAATYALTLTPINGFTGAIALNCTPLVPATYASCSVSPASATLSASAQPVVATISTVTTIASTTPPERTFADTTLCLLFPTLIFVWKPIWKPRRSLYRSWRTVFHVAWAVVSSIALLSAIACGGNTITPSNQHYTPAGNYQYQVTASSTAGAATAQIVTLSLIVK